MMIVKHLALIVEMNFVLTSVHTATREQEKVEVGLVSKVWMHMKTERTKSANKVGNTCVNVHIDRQDAHISH